MTALAGYAAIVKNGSNTLATVTDAELDLKADMYDVSVLNGGRVKQFIPGMTDASFICKLNWDASDTNGTVAFQSNITSSSPSTIAFTLSPNAGTNNYTFNAYIKSMKIAAAVNKQVSADCEVQVVGAVSYA